MKKIYDVAVIGAGPAGYNCAINFAKQEKKVVIIEKNNLGGTCLNCGCIPTKFLWQVAKTKQKISKSLEYGIKANIEQINFQNIITKKNRLIENLSKGILKLLTSNKVDVIKGVASFKSNNTLLVITETEAIEIVANKIIIATGSTCKNIFNIEFDHKKFITSTDALNLTDIPKNMLVIGGGAIGIELSSIFSCFGTAVTLREICPQILPSEDSDLAQELTKDPYNFAFAGVAKQHNEAELKMALLNNITAFLVELGTGFAYVGREYRLQIGHTENFIDLLFYNLRLRCYVVIEVKIGKFTPADIGQIGSYVVAVNHQLREEGKDNPTIGLLICRSKDNTQAKYALESSSQPIGISEYELEQFYPAKVEGTIPTIEEIEAKLNQE